MTEMTQSSALPSELLALVGGTSRAEAAVAHAETDVSAAADATPYSFMPPICISEVESASATASSTLAQPFCISQDADSADAYPITLLPSPVCISSDDPTAQATPYTGYFPYCITQEGRVESAEDSMLTFFTTPPMCIAQDGSASAAPITIFGVTCISQEDSASAAPITIFGVTCISQEDSASEIIMTMPPMCFRGPETESASVIAGTVRGYGC